MFFLLRNESAIALGLLKLHGFAGTMVYEELHQGRSVAVKTMNSSRRELAEREAEVCAGPSLHSASL